MKELKGQIRLKILSIEEIQHVRWCIIDKLGTKCGVETNNLIWSCQNSHNQDVEINYEVRACRGTANKSRGMVFFSCFLQTSTEFFRLYEVLSLYSL